jgi:hypothetical protein
MAILVQFTFKCKIRKGNDKLLVGWKLGGYALKAGGII